MERKSKFTISRARKFSFFFISSSSSSFSNVTSLFFYTSVFVLALFFCFHLLVGSKEQPLSNTAQIAHYIKREECDLFKGRWVRGSASYYTNYTCKTIPFLRNCFLHGREDSDFLNWRWKPEKCELPRFSAEKFLLLLRGKTMAFIGDSLARNQMESLLCLLSMAESPKEAEKHKDIGEDESSANWVFPTHNFTLLALRSQFLVSSAAVVINGTGTGGFHLQLDKPDAVWSEKLPVIDYAVFSDAHWFFRRNYLYEHGKLIGCVYCQDQNVTDLGPGFAIRKAFRTALTAVKNSRRKIFTIVRSYSPAHFENGSWNSGGVCNKTQPDETEVDEKRGEWEYRRIQLEEVENARKTEENAMKMGFEALDVTEMMMKRVDGHPGVHWGNVWMKGYSDCIHWCLPGPIDAWNELLLEVTQRKTETE